MGRAACVVGHGMPSRSYRGREFLPLLRLQRTWRISWLRVSFRWN